MQELGAEPSLPQRARLLAAIRAIGHIVHRLERQPLDQWPEAEQDVLRQRAGCCSSVPHFESLEDLPVLQDRIVPAGPGR